ncbi:periplasmic nitrate reductase, NapE protein [Lysobacter sp. BMK333-48F3]|uniref:periplasmic nitrate reductase, NapE protein n=1 Tax=Lysobacter sp. BMK333-48F3 TaxID=2867962 RepID=UPI001C8B6592|nr:periplasmic nitrate reductase, NapE protein [Lysobacter sp. BMK333-48F3]MBX9402616.1 periplasmic nitrate reductase, NapE protein [Lysobacter sp. BMK333-48F3]
MKRPADTTDGGKRRERAAFLLLTGVVFPLLAVLAVAGYGFAVWIWQIFTGPPTGH